MLRAGLVPDSLSPRQRFSPANLRIAAAPFAPPLEPDPEALRVESATVRPWPDEGPESYTRDVTP